MKCIHEIETGFECVRYNHTPVSVGDLPSFASA